MKALYDTAVMHNTTSSATHACVLLLLCLLHRLPVLKAMKALYDTAVTHKVSWRTATPKADTLSPQLAALLDGMLEPNPVKRFTMQQVAASEWLHMGVPPKLQVRSLRVFPEFPLGNSVG